jgi:hypothetical protein
VRIWPGQLSAAQHTLGLRSSCTVPVAASTMAGLTPKKGFVAEPGFCRDGAGQRRHHDAAGFGLPPGIDDRAAALADTRSVPLPGFRVDRFADGAQQFQDDRSCFSGPFALAHQRRIAVGAV